MQQIMPYFVSVAMALASAALAVGGALYLVRRNLKPDGELAAVRQANMLLERDLAVERERAHRIPDIERQRDVASAEASQEREARARVEQDLAVMREARSQADAVIYDLKTRATKVDAQNAEVAAKGAEATRDLQQQLSGAKAELAAMSESLSHEKRQADEKLKLIQDARDTMTKQFQVLANDLMFQHGETFTKQNKEQLGGLLTPLHEKLKEFQDGLQHAHIDGVQQRAVLFVVAST
jgi:DNA recombination protein RmuC